MELPLNLAADDNIVSMEETGEIDGRNVIRFTTTKGAIFIINTTLAELVVRSNFAYLLSSKGLEPDYANPNSSFVDVAM